MTCRQRGPWAPYSTVCSTSAVFDGPEELREKAEHYLSHPDERQAVARAGKGTILEKHMIAHRVETMLGMLR